MHTLLTHINTYVQVVLAQVIFQEFNFLYLLNFVVKQIFWMHLI